MLLLTAQPLLAHAVQSQSFAAHTPGTWGTVVVVALPEAGVDAGPRDRALLRGLPEHGWDTLSLAASTEALPEALAAVSGRQVWLVQGGHAGPLLTTLNEQRLTLPKALVLIGPYHPDADANAALPEQLARLGIPVLDIHSRSDHPQARLTRDRRQQANQRANNPGYRAHAWTLTPDQDPQALVQLVRGWLVSLKR
ncbi:DUF3530 family protein [Ferrimonas balearica]|uniref:DUF3530 family protein n=1 Tax=Ferrimonas balearica TaxID=44012 RepID=UPI001C98EDCB|nr:DUF3530 family protein [Ferrimonas balearica]MBY5993002.1 alpha/beta hydrolase family protein [Ferrimonas balearica]